MLEFGKHVTSEVNKKWSDVRRPTRPDRDVLERTSQGVAKEATKQMAIFYLPKKNPAPVARGGTMQT
ncbi:MAG: hypothetical protein A2048_06935 [Deltaproteobacteria bacterium GWA2_45_12]|nr:MAG: hypothetical protein A2048_06935 [Deltaproteobacteria bacterium GWA2_45_12]